MHMYLQLPYSRVVSDACGARSKVKPQGGELALFCRQRSQSIIFTDEHQERLLGCNFVAVSVVPVSKVSVAAFPGLS